VEVGTKKVDGLLLDLPWGDLLDFAHVCGALLDLALGDLLDLTFGDLLDLTLGDFEDLTLGDFEDLTLGALLHFSDFGPDARCSWEAARRA